MGTSESLVRWLLLVNASTGSSVSASTQAKSRQSCRLCQSQGHWVQGTGLLGSLDRQQGGHGIHCPSPTAGGLGANAHIWQRNGNAALVRLTKESEKLRPVTVHCLEEHGRPFPEARSTQWCNSEGQTGKPAALLYQRCSRPACEEHQGGDLPQATGSWPSV